MSCNANYLDLSVGLLLFLQISLLLFLQISLLLFLQISLLLFLQISILLFLQISLLLFLQMVRITSHNWSIAKTWDSPIPNSSCWKLSGWTSFLQRRLTSWYNSYLRMIRIVQISWHVVRSCIFLPGVLCTNLFVGANYAYCVEIAEDIQCR